MDFKSRENLDSLLAALPWPFAVAFGAMVTGATVAMELSQQTVSSRDSAKIVNGIG